MKTARFGGWIGISVMSGILLCVPVNAGAEEGELTGWSITPMAGYRDGGRLADPESGDRLNVAGDASFGLAVNFPHSPGREYELFYSRQQTDLGSAGIDVNLEYFQIGGRVAFRGEAADTWLIGGIGATRLRASGPGSGTDTRPSIGLGLGLEVPLAERWAVRLEARGYLTMTGGDRDVLCISDADGLSCKLAWEGSTLFQAEALAGLSYRF